MMIATLLASFAAAGAGEGPASFHPADAVVYVEVPDLQRLVDAYDKAPAVQLARDADVKACVHKLEEALHVDLGATFDAVLGELGVPPAPEPRGVGTIVGYLRMARSASLSLAIDHGTELRAALPHVQEATEELAKIRTALSEWQSPDQGRDVTLADLGLSPELATDPWKRPYLIRHDESGWTALSLGADGAQGGEHENVDLDESFDQSKWIESEWEARTSLLAAIEFTKPEFAHDGLALLEHALKWEARGDASEMPWGNAKAELKRFHAGEPFDCEAWSLSAGSTLVVGIGPCRPEDALARAAGRSASLASSPELAVFERVAGAPTGATVVRASYLTQGVADLFRASTNVPGFIGQISAQAATFGNYVLRMQLVGDRFVTDIVSSSSAKSVARFMGRQPVDRGTLAFVPGEAVGVIASSIDGAGAHDQLVEWLGLAANEGDANRTLSALEQKHAFSLQHDVFDNLGGSAALYMLPITALGPPAMTAVIELRDPAGFEKGVRGLVAALQDDPSADVKVKASKYRDAPMWTFTPNSDEAGGNPLSMSPTLAIVGKRALVSSTSLRAKKEIKRALGEEQSTPHALAAADWPAPADATVVGSMDWGGLVDALYKAARAALALSGMAELPIDTAKISAALPESPQTFTRFFRPTAMWGKPVENGFHIRSEGSFGPETWLGLVGFGATVVKAFQSAQSAPSQATDAAAPADLELAATNKQLAFLATRITVFKLDQGHLPSELPELCKPTQNFPRGFLDATNVPSDGWGYAFEYRLGPDGQSFKLWSIGRDGVDASGAGDDVLAP